MTWVIQNSCNTGISWVAKTIGRNLFYSYMKKFGFNERTGIEFDNESPGKISPFEQWTDSELATHGFGPGITVTPLQMVTAYAAIANKGILMQPHIVESINQQDGKVVKTDSTPIQRVVSEQTSNTITAMLVNNVENGDSYTKIRLPDHYMGAKTGTAQTYKHGKAMSGVGSTLTTVLGFGPIENPKFVILVKMDRPRTSEWADSTSGPLLHDIAQYLFTYYNIQPDKK
jgi:cell division protein FtsI/penicillin-binding protein 2